MSTTKILSPEALLSALLKLRASVVSEGQARFDRWRSQITNAEFAYSAQNLAYYLAFRKRDLRQIQASLQPLGLSSLGRSEARVLENLDAVIAALGAILGSQAGAVKFPERPTPEAFFRGARILDRQSDIVLGPVPSNRRVRIMVTLPTESADDVAFMADLLKRGMNWVRINCAHDSPPVWERMIAALRAAERETGKSCRVMLDLGGPKIRTGAVITPEDDPRMVPGDTVLLTPDIPTLNPNYPFQAQCMTPEVLTQVKPGEAAWIDDGKVGARIERVDRDGALIRITQTSPEGGKLKPEKGLNFPDSTLRVSPLTEKDRADLDIAVRYADAVGYSFLQSASDIARLQREIDQRKKGDKKPLYIIAKIETPRAIRNLPEIIVQTGSKAPFAVLIARGDLAVEIGFQRTVEMQEEIMWLSEAAHVPVIWATQVLETFVKKGMPTRAEMTDAAMSERAECVLLNKGPYVGEAVTLLDDVLTRMRSHQMKKTPQLRALRSWAEPEDEQNR